jgi:hypothetical protein
LEHEILWEADEVALDCLIQVRGLNLIQRGEIAVEHDFVVSDEINLPLNEFNWGHYCSSSRSSE